MDSLPDGELICEVCGLTMMSCQSTILVRPYFYNPFNYLDIFIWSNFIAIIVLQVMHNVWAHKLPLERTDSFVNVFGVLHIIDWKVVTENYHCESQMKSIKDEDFGRDVKSTWPMNSN